MDIISVGKWFKEFYALSKNQRYLIAGLVLGFGLGVFYKTLDISKIQLSFTVSEFHVLLLIIIAVIVMSILVAWIFHDKGDLSAHASAVSGITSLLLVGVMIFAYAIQPACSRFFRESPREDIDLGDMLYISEKAEQLSDYDKAIKWINKAGYALDGDDPRKAILAQKLDELKLKQLKK